ncbi:GGDEF domain-containing protein [Legionella micdadei]|uniref:Diguanylate cyclase (GGDEF) domain-containing protein n=1 Tax=Legionella micdadei TaxID=451 RepID=A0A098GCG2_LEGMI|nr:GGDEF domain-containing protein [Legionella micdadei]KTD29944.1 GGDEF/EAL domain-containing sensory box protein [Legionella micdadei]CEG60174.1 Sensory box protein, EAL domain, GGDEF domain, signal transduction protein [Legionella micdadei]SCY64003.1 diguanylate cyclase (GGDEF) domain-containing protein [Legionella micdadei]
MYLSKQLLGWFYKLTPQVNLSRQNRLISSVSIELIILGLVLLYITFSWELWLMLYLVAAASIIVAANLLILKKTKNSMLCGNILTFSVLITATLANYWMGGISTSYFGWYYVIPVLAASTVGLLGLVVYAVFSLCMVVLFSIIAIVPIYSLSDSEYLLINFINRFFSLFVITTTLYTVLRENILYETMLREHNYLLQADKDKFHYLARYDTLTNLPNRSYFQNYFQSIIESAKAKNYCVTVFFMDLDGLKEVNDRYGHDAGDSLLSQSGKRMQSCFRENDFLSRLGGDEFTAVINHLERDKIPKAIAKRIIQEFNRPFLINGKLINCKISIGLATYPFDSQNPDELVVKADQAMYYAKNAGGNTYKLAKRTKKTFS